MKIIDCIQGTNEWFDVRRGIVTASRFSDVLCKGSGRKTYLYKLAAERITGLSDESYTNNAMQNGTEMEPYARKAYSMVTDSEVEQVGFIKMDDDVGCSPDGLVGEDGGIEIKCPQSNTHIGYIVADKIPAVYVNQVQGFLWVTGRQWCDFISYNPQVKNSPFFCKRISRDEDRIEVIKNGVEKFVLELKEIVTKINNF